jgi:EAL domain-containing protein (putative c-di-GMP-specific phosphodiesterase class I)/GGDEF domain-containing protein
MDIADADLGRRDPDLENEVEMLAKSTENQHVKQDMRRDRRFEVSQPAIICQTGHPEIACEIRDFCQGGLFLRFTKPETAIAALAKRGNAEVEVVFTPDLHDNTLTFRMAAHLKRLSPLGVGVAFVRQPVDALRALQKLRMAGHRQKLTAMPTGGPNPRLRETTTALLGETLQEVHHDLMRVLGDRLNTAALQASGISEHSRLLSAVHEFGLHDDSIRKRFVQQVQDALAQARPVQTQATGNAASGELVLVDEKDFEDWLATSGEVNRLEEQFHEQLADIEPRIGELFGFACDHSNNPFGPAVIAHAYRSALEDLQLLARARQVAYATLRDVLSEQLGPMYAELLAMLPVSELELQRHKPVVSPEPARSNQPAHSTQPVAEPPPAQADATAMADVDKPRPQGTLSRLAGSLMDMFRGSPSNTAVSSAATAPARSGPPAAGVSAAAPAMPMAGAQGMAQSPVLQRLAASGALPQTLTQEMQRSVQMFGVLFDTMHAEKSINEGMRPFFQQLEASLIKLAMSDPAFLESPSHPAHKVLNTLDRISMIAGDNGQITDERLLRLMNRWTERINAEAEKNPGVFEEARTQLERVVKPLLNERAARISRLQEVCEGRQRADQTKLGVVEKLLQRIGDQSVPSVVVELLNGGWRNVLLMAEMRHGADSEAAAEAWQVLQTLYEWLDPQRAEPPTTFEVQQLLQQIDLGLTRVCHDKFSQDRLLDQLATVLLDQDKSQYQYTTIRARLGDSMESEPLSASQNELAERLRVGDWLHFDKIDTPLNLVWTGENPPIHVFANYRGIKKLELKRQNLLQALEGGGVQWAEDMELPLMDRSYSAMIQKMQRDLVWQSTHDPMTGLSKRKNFFRAIRRNWLRSPAVDGGYVIGLLHLDIRTPGGEEASSETHSGILRELGKLLQSRLPEKALLARAGESGIAYCAASADPDAARQQAESLLQAIAGHALEIGGVAYHPQASIGLAWNADCLTPESHYDNASAACASAREAAQPDIVMFDSENHDDKLVALAEWAHELTALLANNQLSLNCQPVAAATDVVRTPLYFEVLLQPTAEAGRSIKTRDLIAMAERLQRISEIDRWVIKQVFAWMRAHPDVVERIGGLSINVSGQSFVNPLFLKAVLAELKSGDVPGNKLIFEISESDAVEGHAHTQNFMRQLQHYGCRFTFDEFGPGSSSYTMLKSLKPDYLKLDRSLVREISTSMIDEALVRSIIETAAYLNLQTVACYVDNAEMVTKLAELGVDCVQGYFVGEPRPLKELAG